MKKTIVALIYDFDKTLCDRDMQEYAFIPNLGLESEEFWHEVDEFAINNRMDKILACMYMMVHKSEKKGTPLKRETCINLGQYIKFYPGITEWFSRINEYGKENNIEIEHYIISSGLKEIIEGTSIAKHFKKIYACEFMYRDGQAVWPKLAVNYTNKTQFVYRINKGVLDISNNVALNSSQPDSEKRVFFSNMIYIGDGLTDVPCMKLVKQSGGHSIALYNPGKHRNAAQLLEQDRVDWMFEADYTEGSDLDSAMKTLLQNLASYNQLQGLKEQQKRDFH